MLSWLRFTIGLLAGESRGGILVTFALSLPVLICGLGVASDYAMMLKLKGDLQSAADAAAIAGAREISVARNSEKMVTSAAFSFAAYSLTGNSSASERELAKSNVKVDVSVADAFSSVEVNINQEWAPFFADFLMSGITPISVSAKAQFVGRNNLCVLGLAAKNRAVYLDKNARLTGEECGVFSNSTDADGLSIDSGATLKASIICSAGGANWNSSASVEPQPVTDCPAIADPLINRKGPAAGGCDYNNLTIKDVVKSLDPGTYCGDLTIAGNAVVTLNPGIYVLKDGGLTVAGTARLQGEGVGFYITGTSPGKVNFTMGSHVSLSAPEDGPLAGLLLFEDRALTKVLKHRITSDDARRLIGTIYLPVGDLIVDAKTPVADQSAYTAIVVQHLELNLGPNLVLNSDYAATDVPVPDGIAGIGQVVLAQ